MLALLVADDPRRSADRILTRLVQIHQARGGAILRPRQGQVEIWMSAGLSLAAGRRAARALGGPPRRRSPPGRSVVEPGFALFPAMLGDEMVAALYLAQPEGLAAGEARGLRRRDRPGRAGRRRRGRAAARARGEPDRGGAGCSCCPSSSGNEWNIAEVARLLGVTRRTVYMRLRSFGIERRRVPKLYKKMPVDG